MALRFFCMTNDLLARVWDGKVIIIIKEKHKSEYNDRREREFGRWRI